MRRLLCSTWAGGAAVGGVGVTIQPTDKLAWRESGSSLSSRFVARKLPPREADRAPYDFIDDASDCGGPARFCPAGLTAREDGRGRGERANRDVESERFSRKVTRRRDARRFSPNDEKDV